MTTANPSQDVLVGAARKLGPLLRENANQGERDRRLPAATMKGLTEAGFFRLCRPRELGGLEVAQSPSSMSWKRLLATTVRRHGAH